MQIFCAHAVLQNANIIIIGVKKKAYLPLNVLNFILLGGVLGDLAVICLNDQA